MKERPILFNDEMVRAILAGRKSQTRRVVKKLPACIYDGRPCRHSWPGKRIDSICSDCWKEWLKVCPFGTVGDRLWVREAWKPVLVRYPVPLPGLRGEVPSDYGVPDTEEWEGAIPKKPLLCCGVMYRATGDDDAPWRPSIHMPRWASRITLEITDVRVERLRDITDEDAEKEGFCPAFYEKDYVRGYRTGDGITWFSDLWDSLNAKRGYSWYSNPWVWVIQFNRT